MPRDNLILGAAVVAAAWLLSDPARDITRGATNTGAGFANFTGDVTAGMANFTAGVADGIASRAAETSDFVAGGAQDVIRTPGRIAGQTADTVTNAVNSGVDAVTNWQFTGF